MRLLYLSFVDISLPKGPSVNEREFILSLSKHQKNVSFVIPKPMRPLEDELPVNKIRFIRPAKIQQPFRWVSQQFDAVRTVNKLIKTEEINFLIIRCSIFDFAIQKILRKNKLPYAIKTAGSGQFNIFEQKNPFIRSLYNLNQKIFKEIIRNAIAVDVVSSIQKESLEKITGVKNKIIFIDNGVNTDRFIIKDQEEVRKELGLSKFKQIIGYVGGSPWERGGLQIIESIPLLQKTFPDIGGVIVGGGNKMNVLYKRAQELDVEDKIVFAGVVPFEKVNDYINTFDIGVSQLYKDKQGSSEQKVRQYLSCGKPVVVSPGAVNNFVEEECLGSIVEDPHDISEFADKVGKLLVAIESNSMKKQEEIRNYAIKHLSVDNRVQERLNLYKKILNEEERSY